MIRKVRPIHLSMHITYSHGLGTREFESLEDCIRYAVGAAMHRKYGNGAERGYKDVQEHLGMTCDCYFAGTRIRNKDCELHKHDTGYFKRVFDRYEKLLWVKIQSALSEIGVL